MKENCKQTTGKISKKTIVIYYSVLFSLIAFAVGFYINNALEVNKLIKKNKELKEKLISFNQNNLKTKIEIENLSSFERICKIAAEKLNMIKVDTAVDKRELNVKIEKENKEN